MKRVYIFLVFASCLLISFSNAAFATDEIKVWKEFIQTIEKGEFSEDMIRPHFESLREPNMKFIKKMREKASWDELTSQPEIFRINSQISYLIPLTFDSSKATYSFTFIEEKGKWYLRHIETIFIRLDQISALPTSEFPDIPDAQKAWSSEEIYWSQQVRLFNFLVEEKGKEFAFNWFKDGMGYFLGAKTWVPFVAPEKAFILYLCWEQANLRGSQVVLEKLEADEAMVRMRPHLINIYLQSSHLKQQIASEDYFELFTTIWQDRAEKAGWKLEIIGGDYLIGFHFTKEN
ncbi:MAG: hypothetical protein ACE5I1_27950 [bacterium]